MLANAVHLAADQSLTDEAIISHVLRGKTEEYEILVRRYNNLLYKTARGILSAENDIEDVMQEAYIRGYEKLGQFRQEAKFSTWLIQITINEARMKLRKDRRHLYESLDSTRENDEGEYIPTDFADWREIPSEALERRELRDVLQKALSMLPEKYRTVLVLRDVQQRSIAETAAILGIREENVKTRTSRARLQMRDLLARDWGRS